MRQLLRLVAITLDCGGVTTVPSPAALLLGGLRVVKVVLVAGFLEMVLQFLFGVAAALTDSAHLLSRRRRMGILVRAVVRQVLDIFLAHNGIVPPEIHSGNPA